MPTSDSSSYYNRNAEEFVRYTLHADLGVLYAPFLALVPAGGHILDAGCGSGRDSLHFLRQGYRVSAFDAAEEMVKTASQLSGLPVQLMRFEDVDACEEYDAVWANASLLHVPDSDLDAVIQRLTQALKPGGVFFMSYKYGNGEIFRSERLFNNFDEQRFAELLKKHPGLHTVQCWVTADVRPQRSHERWLNALLLKK